MSGRGLSRIPTAELARLLAAVERGTLSAPLREAELSAEGFDARDLVALLGGLEAEVLARLVRALIADRERRPPPRLELVWTGPETRVATSRDTAVVVRQLFATARRSVLIAGFSFDHGQAIFQPLHVAMRDRGVTTEIYLDIRSESASARAYADTFLRTNWPFGPPFPTLFHDPRTTGGRALASLHAKCVVVDVERTLVTSANFTDRGQTRNVELGVLVDDRDFAAQVAAQFRSLVEAGLLVSVVPSASVF